MSAKKTFPPRTCSACGKDYTPTGPNQSKCNDCRGETAIGKRIDRVVEKGKRHEPPSAEQAVFGRIHSNGTIKGSKI